MRTVITGGAGFIGSHLCERFLERGHEVVCIDNLITGALANIEHLRTDPRFSFMRHDVSHYIDIDGPIDNILHFASPASPVDYLAFPIQTLKVGSLGTHNTLGLAKSKKARYLVASTSEVYGDPEQHPQREDYWGNVNPVGVRGCYDEAKRFTEAMVMAYHRAHLVDTHIVRIFNSILGDQPILACDEDGLHIEAIEDYSEHLRTGDHIRRIFVPAFDPNTLRMGLREASAFIKHIAQSEAYEIRLRYGRSVKVTGDHSVFVEGSNGRPFAKPVRDIQPGEYVAIPARVPVVEVDRTELNLVEEFGKLAERNGAAWDWNIQHPSLSSLVEKHRKEIHTLLLASERFAPGRNQRGTIGCTTRKWILRGQMPLPILRRLGITAPEGAEVLPYGGGNRTTPNCIPITEDLLWLLGFYLAEGSEYGDGGVYFISFCSDIHFLKRAKAILEDNFGVRVGYTPPNASHGPSIIAHSKVLHRLFKEVLGLRQRRIPAWVMQLPLSRVKHFLEGFRCGDGTHSGKKVGRELCFETTSERLAIDLTYLLLRFGIVASYGRYETTFRKQYGDCRFPFYRLTICELDNFDILTWDQGVCQTLNARRCGDLVWSKVKSVTPCVVTGHVYDFSVPDCENFVSGNGVCTHNTYGPKMRLDDGRVLPNFMGQALRGEPLTIYGDGSQTRSFCYVDDLVDGIEKLLFTDFHDPVNLGNPNELTILEFAREILALSGSKSELVFKALPQDDPKVRKPDITRARTLLGWEPQIDRAEGLKRTLAYFQARIKS